jgi:hypothetical protein
LPYIQGILTLQHWGKLSTKLTLINGNYQVTLQLPAKFLIYQGEQGIH